MHLYKCESSGMLSRVILRVAWIEPSARKTRRSDGAAVRPWHRVRPDICQPLCEVTPLGHAYFVEWLVMPHHIP